MSRKPEAMTVVAGIPVADNTSPCASPDAIGKNNSIYRYSVCKTGPNR